MKSAPSPTTDGTDENTIDLDRADEDHGHENISFEARRDWIRSHAADAAPAISANERTSLHALIAYVAMHRGENEFRVERRLSDRFHVANMTCLPATDYDDAIRFLVDGMNNVAGNA